MLRDLFYHPKIYPVFRYLNADSKARYLFRVFKERRSGTRVIELNGVTATFYKFSLLEDKWLSTELEVLSDVLDELQGTDVFYDIGADTGLYSVFAETAVIGEGSGTVVGFEPHPIRRSSFYRTLNLNHCNDTVKVREEALSDYNGSAKIDYGIVDDTDNRTNRRSFEATVRQGDDLIYQSGLPAPTVLKIDVEGAEGKVLSGLSNTLSQTDVRIVYVEVHDQVKNFGWTCQQVYEKLEEFGYNLEELQKRQVEGSQETFIKAVK